MEATYYSKITLVIMSFMVIHRDLVMPIQGSLAPYEVNSKPKSLTPLGRTLHSNFSDIEPNCHRVKAIFLAENIGRQPEIPSIPLRGLKDNMCSSNLTCCSIEVEDHLTMVSKERLMMTLRERNGDIKLTLSTEVTSFLEELQAVVIRAENETKAVFHNLYEDIADHMEPHIRRLFAEISSGIRGHQSDIILQDAVSRFFSQMFPPVFHHLLVKEDVSKSYTQQCLLDAYPDIQPFGDSPHLLGLFVAKSTAITRALVEATDLIVEVLGDNEFSSSEECNKALTKLMFCSKCTGFTEVKPCQGYCMNVMRGCLAGLADLDKPWIAFLDSLESLISKMKSTLNLRAVVEVLHERISETAMYAMNQSPQIATKVAVVCGGDTTDGPVGSSPVSRWNDEQNPKLMRDLKEDPGLNARFKKYVDSLEKVRSYFTDLPDEICKEEAMDSESHCWNGQTVGEYSKRIGGMGTSAQKYNPEVRVDRQRDLNIGHVGDRLRKMRQNLLSQSTPIPLSSSQQMDFQSDGSGSGSYFNMPDMDSEEFPYHYEGSGEGSGDGSRSDDSDGIASRPTNTDIFIEEENDSSAITVNASLLLVWCSLAVLLGGSW